MNKTELCVKVAERTFYTQKSVAYILDEVLRTVEETLINGDKVLIKDFGALVIKDRNPRIGRNPHTNEEIQIPARRMPYFEPAPVLKELLNASDTIKKGKPEE